jgi:hypothetical protein
MIDLFDRSTTTVEGPNEYITDEPIELIPGVGPIIVGVGVDADIEKETMVF